MVLKTAIQRQFGRCTHADIARDLLSKRRRGVGHLCCRPTHLHPTETPQIGEAVQEELTVQALIRGLQPQEHLKEHLRLHAPSTLTAALEEAERVEHMICPEGHRRSDAFRVSQATCENSDNEEAVRHVTSSP